MNKEDLVEFVHWLPTKFQEFQNATPEEIVQTLNSLAQDDKGKQTIEGMFKTFEQEKNGTGMFRNGGKLDYIKSLKKGGKIVGECITCRKMDKGGEATRNNDKAEANAYYKWGVTPWNFAFRNAKSTPLPQIAAGNGPRSLKRVYSSTGRSIDRVQTPGAYTDRDISPQLDTVFTIHRGPDNYESFRKGTPDYSRLQSIWKKYGIY